MEQVETITGPLGPVLTIRQPYVSRIMQGDKIIENRSWAPKYRGRLYVHSAQKPERDHGFGLTEKDLEGVHVRGQVAPVARDNVLGCIVGHVDLVDIVTDSDHWSALDGYYHWVLANPVEFEEAIPARGRLSLWTWHG
ncbi:ASCH domain-containing protein [Streptomyces sp. NPDC050095]|uniref:ASCH domain-containing protein n=1 Tax=unclassified Streptomyces TaxID=2593676 RepID=UPI0034157E05